MKTTQNKLYNLLKTNEDVFDFFQLQALDGLVYQDLSNPKNSWINDKLQHTLGYTEIDKDVYDHIFNLLNITESLDGSKTNQNQTKEVCFKHKTGKEIWMLATIIYYPNNHVIVTGLKNITQLKEH